MIVVQRAKKCLDFCATIYILHFLLCWIFDAFPVNWEWWLVNIVAMIGMVVLAEFLCLRKEMQDIPRTDTELRTPVSSKAKDER